jgi:6-phosphofructokinase 2
MTEVVTLTLNPTLDITTSAPAILPTEKLRCAAPRFDPGGGGINAARVVQRLGGAALAIFPAGGPAGETLRNLLREQGLPCEALPIRGTTRESFTVDESSTGRQFRFVLPGPELTLGEQAALLDSLARLSPAPPILVMSGSLPPGVDPGVLRQVATATRQAGMRLLLDTSGPALRAAQGAFLVKPNLRELAEALGREIDGAAEEATAARELLARGTAEVVLLSLGTRGALLVAAGIEERFPPLAVPIRSAVGAGDSMVGAAALMLARGQSLHEAARYGMAAGAATLMTPGTELCRAEDVARLYAAL